MEELFGRYVDSGVVSKIEETTFEIIDPITGNRKTITGAPDQIKALKHLASLVEHGTANEVPEATQRALDTGLPPFEVMINGVQAGLAVVGERFKLRIAFIPEVLVSARAMQRGMDVLKPLLAPAGTKPTGVAVLGTVKGDLHDIGKKMVGIMLEGEGFQVHDLGVNVPPEKFLEKIKEVKADIMGMSALLSTTMLMHRETIRYIKEAGYRDKVKIMSGGAPVNAGFAREVGADGYAPDAASAVAAAKLLINPGWNGEFVDGGLMAQGMAA
jgi:5-methyltetrahydrofolate--homocysteine methyltransferase